MSASSTSARTSDAPANAHKAHKAAFAAILIVFIALYARTASYAFVWDDIESVVENPLLQGDWLAGMRASQHDHMDPALRRIAEVRPAHDSWRPVLYLSYRVERALYGPSPAGLHLHNVALGLLAVVLAFALLRRWLRDETKAVIATGMFALHPLAVEPIAYVSGRGDLLAACFALAALVSALAGRDAKQRAPWVAVSALALVLSLLAKEAYVGVPIALGLIAWSQGNVRAHVVDVCAQLAGVALYMALRLSIARAAGGQSSLDGVVLLPGLWLEYARIVLLPLDLSIARPIDRGLIGIGWLALSGVLAAFVVASRKPLAGVWADARLAVAGSSCAIALLGPSAIVAKIMGIAADRYAYLPLIGYAVALLALGSLLLRAAPSLGRLGLVAAAATALLWLAITTVQIPVWTNPRTLYEQAYAMEPSSSFAAYGLGSVHAQRHAWHEAEPLFARAVELDPNNGRAWNNLAVAAMQRGDHARALQAAERALAVSGVKFRALYNVANAQLNLGRRDEGCASLRRALELNPTYDKALELMRHACGGAKTAP